MRAWHLITIAIWILAAVAPASAQDVLPSIEPAEMPAVAEPLPLVEPTVQPDSQSPASLPELAPPPVPAPPPSVPIVAPPVLQPQQPQYMVTYELQPLPPGQVVGLNDPWMTPVPEPGPLLAVATGLIGLIPRLRRRRR